MMNITGPDNPPQISGTSLSVERQPLFYLTAALITGILFDRYFKPSPVLAITILAFAITFSIRSFIAKKSAATTIALLASFAAAGALLSYAHASNIDRSRLKHLYEIGIITADDPVELTGKLASPPEPAPGLSYLDVDAESVRVGDKLIPATGRARLMIALDSEESRNGFERLALDYGSRLRVLVKLERARHYNNPGSPDFNEFLERRGYDLKGTIKSSLLIENLGRPWRNPALAFLYDLRLRLIGAIDRGFEPRVAGTLKAMIAGNRYYLDPQTSERLREGATFHTLVISGFHIGIIAWVLLEMPFGASPARRRRAGLIRTSVVLLAIWAYTVMVGLAAPVTRATVMISIGLIGPLFFRRAARINTLSLAAFILLVAQPALVADPGFQLSFLAVAAIVGLAMPLIEKLRRVGEWRPSAETPHPPRCSKATKAMAEMLFWNERKFNQEMKRSPVRYLLPKTPAARALGRIRMQFLVRAIVTLVITSIAIQLTTLPLMAVYFNRVAPVGVLLNIVAGLLTAVVMLAAIAAITIGAWAGWLFALCAWLVTLSHELLVNSITPFLAITGATFRVAHYEGWQTIIYGLYFAPLIWLAWLIDRWQPVGRDAEIESSMRRGSVEFIESHVTSSARLPIPSLLVCLLALVLSLVAVARPAKGSASGRLAIYFLDVGQGDAALVVFPQGATMLVDAGGDLSFRAGEGEREAEFRDDFSVGEAVVSRFLWSQGRTRIDYVLATHADADHTGGFIDVARNFFIGESIIGHRPADDDGFDSFAEALRARNIPVGQVSSSERFELQGVRIEVLWPNRAAGPAPSRNNDSVVLRLVYGSVAIMLAGDIEESTEEALVRSGFDLRADVLKAPHHGSKTSSTEDFLNAVAPRCAIISVGERSRFGHPHQVVVNRYLARGARLFQTGRDGTITVETDGKSLSVDSYKAAENR